MDSSTNSGTDAVGVYRSEPSAIDRPDGAAPLSRRLPPGGNKVERISQHTKGLVEDVSSWVELKLKLTQIEIEERVDAKINSLIASAVVGVFAALGGLFALIALALGVAALLIAAGLSYPLSYFLGFLFVSLLLFIVAMVIRKSKPDVVSVGDKQAHIDEKKLMPVRAQERLTSGSPTAHG